MKLRLLGAALCWLGFAGAGFANAPEASLRPMPRPAEAVAPTVVPVLLTASPKPRPEVDAIPAVAPELVAAAPKPRPIARPHARPTRATTVMAAPTGIVVASIRPKPRPSKARQRAVAVAAAAVPAVKPGRNGSVCGDPTIKGKTITPIAAKLKGCGLSDGVQITSIDGVSLSTPATIDCPTAQALRAWVAKGVKPAVGKTGGGVAQLQVAASYSCRSRNNVAGAKVSEHGRGHAIDISGIVLKNGTVISVLKGWSDGKVGKILKAMHKAACGPFGTVLGPGSDGYHRDHIHMDTARYRSGRYCR